MSDVTAGLRLVRSNILDDLRERLHEWKKEVPILGGALVIDAGHAYWWYLEFGTATRYIGQDGTLEKPLGIAANQGRSTRYPITRGDQTGVYASGPNQGRTYRKKLRFPYQGKIVYRELVMHPGSRVANRGKGVVRVAIRQAQKELEKKLKAFKRRKTPPTRNELVRTINEVLAGILSDVRHHTPLDHDSDHPTHLKDAWDIRRAK